MCRYDAKGQASRLIELQFALEICESIISVAKVIEQCPITEKLIHLQAPPLIRKLDTAAPLTVKLSHLQGE